MFTVLAKYLGVNTISLLMYILSGVFAVGGVSVIYYLWHADVVKVAQLEFNNAQLQQTLADKQHFADQLAKINDDQKATIDELSAENVNVNNQLKAINDYLNSDQTKKLDKRSSVILIETIKRLSEIK